MDACFDVSGKEFKVDLSYLGIEKYYFDDQLLRKRWSFKFRDHQRFHVDGEQIEIVFSMTLRTWSMQVIRNGELYVEELFPEIKEKIEGQQGTKRAPKNRLVITVLLWGISTFAFLSLIEWLS